MTDEELEAMTDGPGCDRIIRDMGDMRQLNAWQTRASRTLTHDIGAMASIAPEPDRPPKSSESSKDGYQTSLGIMLCEKIEDALEEPPLLISKGKVNLLFTSPPFPLTTKKKYGNRTGEEYLEWMATLAPKLADLLAPDGSIVIEIGNSWLPGSPVMSTLPVETLLKFLKSANLHLCQQFICHNPARIPGPAQWVNIERIRVKDSFTHVWWMARTERPKANNRNVLNDYTPAMERLLKKRHYNTGRRPSGHVLREGKFFQDNGGAIPPSVLSFSNTAWNRGYLAHCKKHQLKPHPARMASGLASFFIRFLTNEDDLVVDPFAGSNTTGAIAEDLRRRWIAVEPVSDYVRGSLGRFPEK